MDAKIYQKYKHEYFNEILHPSECYLSKVIDGYIIPPGLIETFDEFIVHCLVAENDHIMIIGDTGVGKSVFSHIFEKFNENRCKPKEPIVVKANCAHFGNDRKFARSELFGQVKGAFTGATEEKEGLVSEAHGGVLILEEIGELPELIQAMLLRFIDTGEYNKLGSTKTKKAEVQIIGVTNKENNLISEFLPRFFPFYIPPLYERRQDVLFYIGAKFPSLLRSFTGREALILLAYNWPGNVREVETVAKRMLCHKSLGEVYFSDDEKDEWKRYNAQSLDFLDKRTTSIDGNLTYRLLEDLAKWNVNIKFLKSLLATCGVSLSDDPLKYPLENFVNEFYMYFPNLKYMKELTYYNRYDVAFVNDISIATVYMGYLVFCGLFCQNPTKNFNVLADLENADVEYFTLKKEIFPKHYEAIPCDIADYFYDMPQFLKSIMSYVQRVPFQEPNYTEDIDEFWAELEEQKKRIKNSDKPEDVALPRNYIDVYGKTRDQVLKSYYEYLLTTTGGVEKRASALAGVPNSTFRGQCEKLGVSPPEK